MVSDEKATPLLMCLSCGRPQSVAQHLCEHCGAPLTPHASTDPVMGILARGFAARKATTEPKKLIVVIGIWLWMIPLLYFGTMLFLGGLDSWGSAYGESGLLSFFLLSVVSLLGLVLLFIAIAIASRTTIAYFFPPADQVHVENEAEEEETIKCLDCGKKFNAQAARCPECGWTYESD